MHAAILLLALLPSAPLPLAKAPKAHPPAPMLVPAAYAATWLGSECRIWLHIDGTFACLWHGSHWEGRWECEKGVLKVVEWPVTNPMGVLRWEIVLGKCGMKGTCMPGKTEWSVRFAPADKEEIR